MKNLIFLIIIACIFFILILGCSNANQNTSNIANAPIQTLPSKGVEPMLSKSQTEISKNEFGEKWALTVDAGILECQSDSEIKRVLFTANGKTYAVNGAAKSAKKYTPIDEIWADDPKISGAKQNLGSIIESGLKLCQ